MTGGHAILPYLVRYIHRCKKLRYKLNTQILYKEYTILWFEFDLCGLRNQQDRDEIHVDPEFKQELDTLQGKFEVMNLLTRKGISRRKFTPILIT